MAHKCGDERRNRRNERLNAAQKRRARERVGIGAERANAGEAVRCKLVSTEVKRDGDEHECARDGEGGADGE